MSEKIPIYFFHDVLDAYSLVAAERLQRLKGEFADALEIELRPYPLRPHAERPDAATLKRMARNVRRAAKEPEGDGLTPELWLGSDPPLSSTPALLAAEAALLQGRHAQEKLVWRLRNAALRGGVNVARRDVILEAASASSLDLNRFLAAFDALATQRAVELAHRDAVAHGVRAVPAIAIGDSWLMTGLRDLGEYRDALLRWLEKRGAGRMRVVH
jgi:predicted DsbA family dithiol-disulfide isomerase